MEQRDQNKSKADATFPGIQNCVFKYGMGMQKKWVENNRIFLDFIARRYGQITKASLEAGELVVTEVDETLIPKFDTEDEQKDHISALKFWEKEQYEIAKEDYNKFSRTIRKDLSGVYGILHTLCDVSLSNRLEA